MHDIAFIGGGPVGLSAALAAKRLGLDPIVFEAKSETAKSDPRVFALSYGARLILERLGVWSPCLEAAPIREVHVSQRGRFGHTILRASELEIDALGYVVPYASLLAALHARVVDAGVRVVSGAHVKALDAGADAATVHYELDLDAESIEARIVAQADGGSNLFAKYRSTDRDYGQIAVIAEIACGHAEPEHAYERFTGRGPIALLPVAGAHALIWTVPAGEAERLLALDDGAFEKAFCDAYGERIGEVHVRGPRASFRLKLHYAHRPVSDRHVLIGNAAQTLHPVAGQGFNIGLRDAFELADALANTSARGADLLEGLRSYRSSRRIDRAGGTFFTDLLVRVFSNDDPVLGLGRSLGLFALDASGSTKRFLMRRMIFGNPG
jgi:2-octaprenyl-6-methoxyphenol hydroxylase